MLGLKIAVIGMGVLIVAGVGVLAFTIVGRMSPPAGANASLVLDEPAGTHILGASVERDRLAVTLQGGGADRVVVLDARSGRVVGRVSLAR